MIVTLLAYGSFMLLLVVAAGDDLRELRIPNGIVAALAAVWIVYRVGGNASRGCSRSCSVGCRWSAGGVGARRRAAGGHACLRSADGTSRHGRRGREADGRCGALPRHRRRPGLPADGLPHLPAARAPPPASRLGPTSRPRGPRARGDPRGDRPSDGPHARGDRARDPRVPRRTRAPRPSGDPRPRGVHPHGSRVCPSAGFLVRWA